MKRTTTDQYDIRGILEEMRDDYRRTVEVDEDESITATCDYVIFALGNELYGIESRFSREVLRLPRFVPVPRLPEHFVGLFNLRGQIHAITDLRPLLDLPRQIVALRTQVIVVEAAGLSTALCTDGVKGIAAIPLDSIEPLQTDLSGFAREVLSGRAPYGAGTLLLLDLEKLLDRPELTVEIFSESL
ncbi:MAG: chemotaxis protein CheW [Desulfuromonadales bacterium]|nr:chemotaxis protein CheW [Desulfuromonadales bacterium]